MLINLINIHIWHYVVGAKIEKYCFSILKSFAEIFQYLSIDMKYTHISKKLLCADNETVQI